MNEAVVEQVVEQEIPQGHEGETKPLSIAEHAKQFGPQAKTERAAADAGKPVTSDTQEAKGDDLKPIRPVDQQRRDQGKFAEGHQRIKPSEAVKRINELTGRAKTAEERLAVAEAELAQLRRQHATPQQIERAEQKVERAEQRVEQAHTSTFREPEPKENDEKYQGDYGLYLRDLARWEGRKAYHEAREAERAQQTLQKSLETFAQRIEVAKTKYPDFEAVAFGPTNIPEGSLVDRYIMERKHGADVLYYLQSHPQERDAILRMADAADQFEALTLIAQRFASSPERPSAQAGTTSAAAGRTTVVLPPRPPTLVRAEAQRVGGSPPPTDGSLSIAEHAKAFGPQRRVR